MLALRVRTAQPPVTADRNHATWFLTDRRPTENLSIIIPKGVNAKRAKQITLYLVRTQLSKRDKVCLYIGHIGIASGICISSICCAADDLLT